MTRPLLLFFALLFPGAFPALAANDDLNPFGVGSSAEASGRYAAWMPKMAEAGVKWVRTFPEWNQLQPSRGTWNWAPMDSLLDASARHQLNVSGLFLYTAKWLNAKPHTFPADDMAWSTYVSNVVRHAAGRVRYWEVWNEPQNFASDGTPADYARIVMHAYDAAKAADPNARVGLSVASVDILYLEQTLAAGAKDHFDFICVHPYEVLGTVSSGQEALFLNIIPMLRKMLATKNPERVNAPVWFTEIGEELSRHVNLEKQAQDLVKAYVLSLAQGASQVEWFEAQEGGYKMGLLDSHGNPTPSYTALKNLAAQLGPRPAYQGWVLLNGNDYGFVFQGAARSVLAAWAPPHSSNAVDFGQTVELLNPVDGAETQAASCTLSNAPMLVLGVPEALCAQAKRNRNRPLPWNGNYSEANSVSVSFASPDGEKGLHLLNSEPAAVTMVDGVPARDCHTGPGVTFTVDPNFLCYTQVPIKITAVLRSLSTSDNPGFNLKYESSKGRKGIGWNSVPADNQWHTLTWTISDDEFVGDWGYHFSFDSDSAKYSKYYLREVTVTKLGLATH